LKLLNFGDFFYQINFPVDFQTLAEELMGCYFGVRLVLLGTLEVNFTEEFVSCCLELMAVVLLENFQGFFG
jgi:hypothetical protein